MALTTLDLKYLRRALDLARDSLTAGDEPFGSVLVDSKGNELFADHNRVSGGDATQHPEFAISRWAAQNLTPNERAQSTVYTSGEHCPMCSASHGWVGLGRIVYIASSKQLSTWLSQWRVPPSPVKPLSITEVVPDAIVEGPVLKFESEIRELYRVAFAP
ncbi:MAG TPA: nucleoside deaminase [Microbacteriaceae bacterium]|nr:nucleoside deaminase [Microbacteriaceae bacterium]